MAILITTGNQIDTYITNISNFIKDNIVTNTTDYNTRISKDLELYSYFLSNQSFRLLQVEGILIMCKNRHGFAEPRELFYYTVLDGNTPQDTFKDWCSEQTIKNDKDPNRFLLDHRTYYYNLNDLDFYQLRINSDNILVEPVI